MTRGIRGEVMRKLDWTANNIGNSVDLLCKCGQYYETEHPEIYEQFKAVINILDMAQTTVKLLRNSL